MSEEEKEGQGFTVKDKRIFSPDREEEPEEKKREEPEAQKPERESRPKEDEQHELPFPEPSFSTFLTFFFFQQAIMFLGEIPHPETEKVNKNLPMAKYLIDTLAIIKEKTRGNLASDEQSQLDTFLTELRMRYVKAVEGKS